MAMQGSIEFIMFVPVQTTITHKSLQVENRLHNMTFLVVISYTADSYIDRENIV